jgi:hypothetical protein
MFLLDTKPLLKIFDEQKVMGVNKIFEGRKNWEFHTLFPQLLEQPCKFYNFRMLPETFWYILNYIFRSI